MERRFRPAQMVAHKRGSDRMGCSERVRFVEWVATEGGTVKVLNKYEGVLGSATEQSEEHADLKVRWLTEEEKERGGVVFGEEGKKAYRLQLRKVDLMNHGGLHWVPGLDHRQRSSRSFRSLP